MSHPRSTPADQRLQRGAVHVADLADDVRADMFERGGKPYADLVVSGLGSDPCPTCRGPKRGVRRTAVNEFGRMMREAGKARDFAQEMQRLLGGRSVSAAVGALETVERVNDASPEDIARAALEALDAYCAERGITVEQARESLAVRG